MKKNIFKTKGQAIGIIIITSLIFILQLYIQTKGSFGYDQFLIKYTINLDSGLESILTSMFLHGNIIHIGMNMFMLYLLSTMFSENSSFLKVYFISGLLSGIFSIIYINLVSPSYVLGASGAIFGIFSYIFFKNNRRKEFYLNFIIFNVGMVIFGMNIAWYAHLGGAIAGILYYYYENDIMTKIKRKKMKRI